MTSVTMPHEHMEPFQIMALASIIKAVMAKYPEELIGPQDPVRDLDLVNEMRANGIYEDWEMELAEQFDETPAFVGLKYRDVCEDARLSHVNGIIEELIEYYMVPSEELKVYRDLQSHLQIETEWFDQLTEAQKVSAARVLVRQGKLARPACVTDYLGLSFEHIMIGIEKDGYAHS